MPLTALARLVAPPLLAAGILLLLATAVHDVATRTIPNRLVLGIGSVGLICQLLTGNALSGLLAAAAVLTCAVVCWRRGYLGGGDAKLLAAASLMVPANQVASLVLSTAIAGGVLSLSYLVLERFNATSAHAARSTKRWRFARILRVERRRLRHGITLPYATAIAAGTIFVLWRG